MRVALQMCDGIWHGLGVLHDYQHLLHDVVKHFLDYLLAHLWWHLLVPNTYTTYTYTVGYTYTYMIFKLHAFGNSPIYR